MKFSADEMGGILESFTNIFRSIWQSIKLAWATIELNLKVIKGTWKNSRADIEAAYGDFEAARKKYDTAMSDNLKYFKSSFLESRLDTLGGFGPQILAFASNPLLFATGYRSAKTIAGTPGLDDPAERKVASSAPKATTPKVSVSPRLKRALEFFQYDASRSLSEAAETQSMSPAQANEMKALQRLAAGYVEQESKNAAQLLGKISGLSMALKQLLDAKTFEELTRAMSSVDKAGFKMSSNGIVTATKNIRAEFKKQLDEDPEKFRKAVADMIKRSPGIKDSDPVESAMKFTFGIAKANMQQQLIKLQQELLTSSRAAMKLPVDAGTREKLSQTDVGKKYLTMIDNFERSVLGEESSVAAAKRSLKNAAT